MAGQPIATLGSMTVCPLCNGTVPHVGGPIIGPGMPGVTINGQPVAVMGDMGTCVGPPATVVQGCPEVTINGTPVATVGCMTSHGGQITSGIPGVTIGPVVPTPNATMPLKKIPFPKINILDDVGAAIVGKGKSHQQGKENIERLKKEAEDKEIEPSIYNIQWKNNETRISESEVLKTVIVSAYVSNADEGETVEFSIQRINRDGTEETIELSGQVKDGMVEASFEIEEKDTNQ